MPRYIDADALMKEFIDFVRDSNNSDFAPVPTWNDAVSLVGSAPTADVPERNVGKWIPVTEQLPEDGQNVLVTVEGWYEGNMFERDADLATYFSFGGYIDGFDTVNDWIEYGEWKATAWMPLPEPFRKETEDE